jgi:DNA (cytosine-5)-methyltransferase 1
VGILQTRLCLTPADTAQGRQLRLLDAFCCAGGATKGYQQAGFHVTGVDINPQPNYCGDEFIQGDAVEFIARHGAEFDAIHASPPCQGYLNLTRQNKAMGRPVDHPNLIAPTRAALLAAGRPYVIENVQDARTELLDPVRICGTGLGLPLRRHRLFEASFPLDGVPCDHGRFTEPKYWTGWRPKGEHRLSTVVQVYGNAGDKHEWPAAMGIEWASYDEIAEAIPPAYTEHVGRQLVNALAAV